MERKEESNCDVVSPPTRKRKGYGGDEPDHKRIKHETSFQNISQTAVIDKSKKSTPCKLGMLNESLAVDHVKIYTNDRFFTSKKKIQNEDVGYVHTKTSSSTESVEVVCSPKKPNPADLSGPSSNEKTAISSKQEYFEEAVISKNDDQQDTLQPGGVPEKVIIKKDEYVYRLLRFDERFQRGLLPKDIRSKTTIKEHVKDGSKGVKSRFISCCKTISGLEELASLTNKPMRFRGVVRINITKLNPEEVKVIDLTKESVRRKHILRNTDAWKQAERFEEVLLEPKSKVPGECIEKIGTVQSGIFTKYTDVIL